MTTKYYHNTHIFELFKLAIEISRKAQVIRNNVVQKLYLDSSGTDKKHRVTIPCKGLSISHEIRRIS